LSQQACSIVDIALWDALSRRSELPLWRLLGGHKPEGIPTYQTAGWLDLTTDQLVRGVAGLLEDGWRAIKVKVGHTDPADDIARLQAVRALGYDFDLMVDANQRWDRTAAHSFARGAAALGISWLEEPLPDDPEAHASLAKEGIPIAVGENLTTSSAFFEYSSRRAAQILQPDVTRLGGVSEWLEVAGLATCQGAIVVPHHAEYAQVHQHLALATRAAPQLEAPWPIGIFAEPCQHRPGWLSAPTAPGASTAIDPAVISTARTA
jgi:L-alanine-DL-glutamate epimerase-like enolase superfamily enzyme